MPRGQAAASSAAWGQPKRAHLVVGPRQAGKSTLIWHHLVAGDTPPIFVNAEHRIFREAAELPPLFLDWLRTMASRPSALFIEEAQHLEEAGLFIKGLVDLQVEFPLLVTGSSAYDLRARTHESLAGRATRTMLWPFSAQEALQRRPGEPPGVLRQRMTHVVTRMAVRGGYPAVWLSPDSARDELILLYEAFIIRDASDLYRVPDTAPFRRLLRLAAGQIGSLVNLSEWGATVELDRRKVGQYLSMLEDAHIVRRVEPFVGGKRAELKGTPKLYFVDNGLRNMVLGDLSPWEARPDRGALFENFVFTELSKQLPWLSPLRYWRSAGRAEVNFVIEHQGLRIGVEAKSTAHGRKRLSRSALSFIRAYRPHEFWIIHLGETRVETLDRVQVRWLHPVDLAEALAQIE